MALNLDTIGKKIGPLVRDYDWKDMVLSTLDVGAGFDDIEYCCQNRMCRPILCRRASDLLDCHVGESERRIARAFREAEKDDALLLIDEVGHVHCPHLWVATRESTSSEFKRGRIPAEIERGDRGILWDPAISADGTRLCFSDHFDPADVGQNGVPVGGHIWQAMRVCR